MDYTYVPWEHFICEPRCKELVVEVIDENFGAARRLAVQFANIKTMKDIVPRHILDATAGGPRSSKVNHYHNIKITGILSFNVI